MSSTLTYGLIKPVDGDSASTWFDAFEADITAIDAHTHNGVNSPAISSGVISAGTIAVASGSWGAAVSTGVYRQTINLPSGFTFANTTFSTYNSSNVITQNEIEKVSTTSVYIYTGDNTQSYTVVCK